MGGVVSVAITKVMRKAEVPGTPYWLRHTYAQNLLESGASIFEIKEMLGHDCIPKIVIPVIENFGPVQTANKDLRGFIGQSPESSIFPLPSGQNLGGLQFAKPRSFPLSALLAEKIFPVCTGPKFSP